VSGEALYKRFKQGWLVEITDNVDTCIDMIRKARRQKKATSIGYHGNIVDLWYHYKYIFIILWRILCIKGNRFQIWQ